MVKVGKVLTKEKLLKETYELKQKVAKLGIQIELLKEIMASKDLFIYKPAYQPVMPPEWRDWVYPYMPDAGETGDLLPAEPNITICYDNGTKIMENEN